MIEFDPKQSFSQINSGSIGGILSCDFVQFCSNNGEKAKKPFESSIMTPSDEISDDTQLAPRTSELIPDITSNISLMMTPDLPENLAIDDLHNPVDQGLQITNDTIRSSTNNTATANNLTVPQETMMIGPNLESTLQSLGENLSVTIHDELRNRTEAKNSSIIWKNYTSPKHGFSIEYPAGMTLVEGRESPYDPYKDLTIRDFSNLGFSFAVSEPDIMPIELQQHAIDVLKLEVEGYEYDSYIIPITEVELLTINNRTAYTYITSIIDKETDKSKLVQQSYYTSNGDRVYHFFFTINTEDVDSTRDIRDHMIYSIKFKDQILTNQHNTTILSSRTEGDIVSEFVINHENPLKDSIIGHCELMNKEGINNPLKDCMYEYYDLMIPDYKQEIFK
jgi:hypothetical protein